MMEIQNALCELIVHDVMCLYNEYEKVGYDGTSSYGYAQTRFECINPFQHQCTMTLINLETDGGLYFIRNKDAYYAIRICNETIIITDTSHDFKLLELETAKVLDEEYLFQKSLIHDISAFNVTFFKLLLNLCKNIHHDYQNNGAIDD